MTFSQLQKIFNSQINSMGNDKISAKLVEGRIEEFPKDRDFAYACTDSFVITVSPRLKRQKISRIIGLIRHELGHLCLSNYPNHSEQQADDIAEEIWGDKIYYDAESVQTIVPLNYPRPRHIHQ